MSATYLDAILEYHRARVAADTRQWRDREHSSKRAPSLTGALRDHRKRGLAVIAEVKRRSPSKGWLAEGLDAGQTAVQYVQGGASAISVLTDEPHFGGCLDDLVAVVSSVDVPVLRKDFILGANDIVDAAESGASAVLLIVAALSELELVELMGAAHDFGLDALVEVHTTEEARRAIDHGAELIGVNQRDLHSFDVDPERAAAVASVLPSRVVAVAESGFADPAAAARAAAAGFDAVLVGESLVTSTERSRTVANFVGAPISERAS